MNERTGEVYDLNDDKSIADVIAALKSGDSVSPLNADTTEGALAEAKRRMEELLGDR